MGSCAGSLIQRTTDCQNGDTLFFRENPPRRERMLSQAALATCDEETVVLRDAFRVHLLHFIRVSAKR